MLEIVCFIIKSYSDKYQNLYTSWIEAFKKYWKKLCTKKKLKINNNVESLIQKKIIDEKYFYDWQMIDFTQIFTVHNSLSYNNNNNST